MEQDRYQKNHKLFILGLFSLVLSLSLFAFSLYLLPNLFFGATYDVPWFIANWVTGLHYAYDISEPAASKIVFLVFFLSALIFAIIAYISSNRIDDQIYSTELEIIKPVKVKRGTTGALRLALQILFAIVLVFLAVLFVEWLLNISPEQINGGRQFVRGSSSP